MSLKLDNILITGRLHEGYIAFFNLSIEELSNSLKIQE